jgi:hypothetical protein
MVRVNLNVHKVCTIMAHWQMRKTISCEIGIANMNNIGHYT